MLCPPPSCAPQHASEREYDYDELVHQAPSDGLGRVRRRGREGKRTRGALHQVPDTSNQHSSSSSRCIRMFFNPFPGGGHGQRKSKTRANEPSRQVWACQWQRLFLVNSFTAQCCTTALILISSHIPIHIISISSFRSPLLPLTHNGPSSHLHLHAPPRLLDLIGGMIKIFPVTIETCCVFLPLSSLDPKEPPD